MPSPETPKVNTSEASIARVYDAVIGGKDNFEVDREVAEVTLGVHPAMPRITKSGRRWLVRVVSYLADRCGMDQFLDAGAGLPTVQNTHEVAQRYQPHATVVYIDNDPAVHAYGRALLASNDTTFFSAADLTQPAEVVADPQVRELNFHRAMALMQCLTMHHIEDETDPWRIMRGYVDALPRGSYVAFSHLCMPDDNPEGAAVAQSIEEAWRASSMGTGRFRSPEHIRAMLDGLELLEPGLVPLERWWPEGPLSTSAADEVAVGALAYKP